MTLTALQTESPDLAEKILEVVHVKPRDLTHIHTQLVDFDSYSAQEVVSALAELVSSGLLDLDDAGKYGKPRSARRNLRVVTPPVEPDPVVVEPGHVAKARKAFEFTSSGQTMGAFGNPFAEEPPVTTSSTPESGPEIAPEASSLLSKGRDTPKGGSISQSRSEGRKVTGSSEKPKPQTLYRDPESQNEHAFAIMNTPGLTTTERYVGMVMHYQCYGQEKPGATLSPQRELTPEYLAGKADLKKPETARKAAKRLVEAGLFVRTDSGSGGRVKRQTGGRGYGATYRPVMPKFSKV